MTHRDNVSTAVVAPQSQMPLVSIGLPVYNGSTYLRSAIESVLAQTYEHIELVICDNSSTDDTFRICQEYATRDARVRLVRNDKNIGAAGNYNRVFHLAKGKYFKWAAHDDTLAPTFIARAVKVLESDSDVVLCSSKTLKINESGETIGDYLSDDLWEANDPAERFRTLIMVRHSCVAVFGLIRRSTLSQTPLIAPYVGSDRVLLAELGLRGKLLEIPEYLFSRRDHPQCSVRSYADPRDRASWFDPSRRSSFAFPEWCEVLGYADAVRRTPLPMRERMKCAGTVGRWALSRLRPLLADFKYAAQGVLAQGNGRKDAI